MKTVAFLSQKGGSGKTTLAVHIAVAAAESGETVAIIDTDPQASATSWRDARRTDDLPVATVSPTEIGRVMDAAAADGITLAIVDTAPHARPEAIQAARVADLIVIPCRPTAFDLAAVGAAVDIAQAAGRPTAFVLNACPVRAPETDEAQAALGGYGLPIAPVLITDRRAFSRAVATGRAVTEFEPRGKAAQEINELWKWIKEQMA